MAEKLAKIIRNGDFDDQDLAHFDKLQVADLVPLAFTDPIEHHEPARITFIVVRRGHQTLIRSCKLQMTSLMHGLMTRLANLKTLNSILNLFYHRREGGRK